jgi:hypothetical protein
MFMVAGPYYSSLLMALVSKAYEAACQSTTRADKKTARIVMTRAAAN